MEIGFTDLAQKYLQDHKSPIVKVEWEGTKFFLPSEETKEKEQELLEKNRQTLRRVLLHSRVERRCARTRVEWWSDVKLGKITKSAGSWLPNFGYQDKNGKFLYPEECLFLLETNKIELNCKGILLSIQEAYQACLGNHCITINYQVYKKLALQGFKLWKKLKNCNKFIKIGECSTSSTSSSSSLSYEPPKKLIKLDDDVSNDKADLLINIFENLQKNGPKPTKINKINRDPDYYVFLPNNLDKTKPDFNLYIYRDEMPDILNCLDETALFALCQGDNIGFYRITNITIPSLVSIK